MRSIFRFKICPDRKSVIIMRHQLLDNEEKKLEISVLFHTFERSYIDNTAITPQDGKGAVFVQMGDGNIKPHLCVSFGQ